MFTYPQFPPIYKRGTNCLLGSSVFKASISQVNFPGSPEVSSHTFFLCSCSRFSLKGSSNFTLWEYERLPVSWSLEFYPKGYELLQNPHAFSSETQSLSAVTVEAFRISFSKKSTLPLPLLFPLPLSLFLFEVNKNI